KLHVAAVVRAGRSRSRSWLIVVRGVGRIRIRIAGIAQRPSQSETGAEEERVAEEESVIAGEAEAVHEAPVMEAVWKRSGSENHAPRGCDGAHADWAAHAHDTGSADRPGRESR